MTSQIFKLVPDISYFKDILDSICEIENNKYIINNASFKKGMMFNNVSEFCSNIEKYYYESKKKYIQRKMTYKYFLTIVRQLCKVSNINYETVTKYNKSTYEIIYFVEAFN